MDKPDPGRRGFFREFLKRVVDPAAYAEQPLPQQHTRLRPPGALPERAFLDTCQRCGQCGEVCPAEAIKTYQGPEEALRDTPYIDPADQPCVACDGLLCMSTCPSGALMPLPLEQIRIGLARVDQSVCVRRHDNDCRVCLDNCPLGEQALRLDDEGKVQVLADGCIGCGVCQWTCPTNPKAIVVEPL